MNRTLTLLLAALLAPVAATAANLPPPVLPQGVGVSIHFTRGHERDLDMIADAGFKIVRMDLKWEDTERYKGVYDWSAYDELTANLEKRGIRPYYILDFSNRLYEGVIEHRVMGIWHWYDDVLSPQHPVSVAAFARWAGVAAAHFHDKRVIWEIWNEPNIPTFWHPAPNVDQYNALARATCAAVRRADPQATVVAPALSEVDLNFLEGFLRSGALDCVDAISVHPYRSPDQPPETVWQDYVKLRELVGRYTPPAKKGRVPILSGEWGYNTANRYGVTPQVQAEFIVRQQLFNLERGVPLSIWYDWKNDGDDPANGEHNYGTVTSNLTPKPAYASIRTMNRELAGYHIVRRLGDVTSFDFAVLLTNPAGHYKIAVWSGAAEHDMRIEPGVSFGTITATSLYGQPAATPAIVNGGLVVRVNATPQYLDLGNSSEHP